MVEIKNLGSLSRFIFDLKLGVMVFFHYFLQVLSGKLSLRVFFNFMKRMSLLPVVIKNNKYVKIGNKTRIGLYIPAIPSKAYYTTCNKYLEFEKQFPCLTVLISITSACGFKCEHCYQEGDTGKDIDIELLIAAVKRLQDLGAAYFTIEGGEPFLVYDRLKRVCEAIDDRSEIWIYSTGDKFTKERLLELKSLGVTAISFSMHSPYPEKLNQFMKSDSAWDTMVNGINLCHEVDMPVAFNMCVPKKDFYNGTFEEIMEKVKSFNAYIIQIIHPKPAGAWLHEKVEDFSEDDLNRVKELVKLYNFGRKYRDYPAISAQIIEEDKDVFGCTAGGIDRFYINAKGDVQPCEFLNLSFGNIAKEDFNVIYERMRDQFRTPSERWLCSSCGEDISKVCTSSNTTILPLDEELSKEVYMNWNKGNPTKFYEKLEGIGKNS